MHKKKIKIILTGGGTAGHVLPHFALLPFYKDWDVLYVGTSGIEKTLAQEQGLRFRSIRTGKLRRHLSLQNFFDIFWVFFGCLQSLLIIFQERPQIVFTKGGYVSVPVAFAAWCFRIPVITHESDLTPGLANKIIAKFSQKILCAFPDTVESLPKNKALFVGLPIRPELALGDKIQGIKLCHFEEEDLRPILLIMGGSQGAARINQMIETIVPELLKDYRVIHITGRGKHNTIQREGYFQVEFVSEDLKHILAATDFVVCRAGANSIFEMLALKKPMLLIPLEIGSRGDQVQNAAVFSKKHWALTFRETELSPQNFSLKLKELRDESPRMLKAMDEFPSKDIAHSIFSILESVVLQDVS